MSLLDLLNRLLVNSRQYMDQLSTKNIVNDEDILEEIRPFCADETVPPEIKPVVLELLEQYITLSGEDRIMLLYYQTNAIVSDIWDIKVISFERFITYQPLLIKQLYQLTLKLCVTFRSITT